MILTPTPQRPHSPSAHTFPPMLFVCPQAMYQEKLCKLPGRYLRLAEMSLDRVKKQPKSKFSWIFDREA